MATHTLTILEQKEIAKETVEVTFGVGDIPLSFRPGAHITIILPELHHEDARGPERTFSIVSSPEEKESIKIAFRVSGSGFKRTLLELPLGSEVLAEEPEIDLLLPKMTDRPLVLIAGGIGITPFMSILRYLSQKPTPYNVTLLYFNTKPERAVYLNELDQFAVRNQNFTLRKKFGDITQDFIEQQTKQLKNPLWFIAGPPAMVDASRDILQAMHIPGGDIFTEELTGYSGNVHLASYLHTELGVDARLHEQTMDQHKIAGTLLEVLDKVALVCITNVTGDITYANNQFIQATKYSAEELIGKNTRLLRSEYHTSEFYKNLWQSIAAGDIWRGEIKNKAKDSSYFWIDSVIAPVFDKNGKVISHIAVSFPISERKQIEEELRAKSESLTGIVTEFESKNEELQKVRRAVLNLLEDLDQEKKEVEAKVLERTSELEDERLKLSSVAAHMEEGAILLDQHGQMLFANNTIRTLLDIEDTNKTNALERLFEKFEGIELKKSLQRVVADQTSESFPGIIVGDKTYDILFRHIKPETNRHSLVGTLIFVRDVTDEAILERSKSELVAVASHQLRTPLTAMRGNIEMLIDESFGTISSEQRELLDDIQTSTIRLITMVNEMLDITKIEKGDLELTTEEINIVDIMDSVIGDLSDYAKRHQFTIVHTPPSKSITIMGDTMRIRQVLQNLTDNAIKYCSHPGRLEVTYDNKDKRDLTIAFKDDGIGIPRVEQSKMFGRFYRASNTAKTTSSGSGLGLYIVKSIIEQSGGHIRFESEENTGTTFFVTLPKKAGRTKNKA